MKKNAEILILQLAELMQSERINMLNYAFCRLGDTEEAADVLQDVYLSVHTQICSDHCVRILNLKSYLFRALANHCNDRLQSRSKRIVISLDDMPDVADSPSYYNEEDYARITRMLGLLPEEQAEVIRMRIYANKSFVEIAAILALPISTVKSRLIYGLNKLRKQLNAEHKILKPQSHDM